MAPAGIKELKLEVENGRAVMLTVDMGEAVLTSQLPETILVDGKQWEFTGIDVGNPSKIAAMALAVAPVPQAQVSPLPLSHTRIWICVR